MLGGARRPQREERGGGISWRPPAYSLLLLYAVVLVYAQLSATIYIATCRSLEVEFVGLVFANITGLGILACRPVVSFCDGNACFC